MFRSCLFPLIVNHDRNMPLCPQPIDIISCDEPFQPVIRLGIILATIGNQQKKQPVGIPKSSNYQSLPYHAFFYAEQVRSQRPAIVVTSYQDRHSCSAVALTFPMRVYDSSPGMPRKDKFCPQIDPNGRSSADLRCGFPWFSVAHGQLKSHPIPPF